MELFNSSTENKSQRAESALQKVEADLLPYEPATRAESGPRALNNNQYLKPALLMQHSSLRTVSSLRGKKGTMAIWQRSISINGLIVNSNRSFNGLYKIQGPRLLSLVEQERSHKKFSTTKIKIISTATGHTLTTVAAPQQSNNSSVVVWGTNLESGAGKGKITNVVRKMYDLPRYQSSVILGLLLSDG